MFPSRPVLIWAFAAIHSVACAGAPEPQQAALATLPRTQGGQPIPLEQVDERPGMSAAPAGPNVDPTSAIATTQWHPRVSRVARLLGFELGTRPVRHDEVLRLWRTWSQESPRVRLESYGSTHEGRELLVGIVSSPDRMRDLESALGGLARLADPRGIAQAELDKLARTSPAVAWVGCSIHGDELSGVDGGLLLAERLIAGDDAVTRETLNHVIVVIDPVMNPDGRERMLGMLTASVGSVPNLDDASMQRGRWPWGRGNHYLFDMNRDWMSGIAPETRGRWTVLRRYPPQLFVDAHEMGSQDTFLFYPQASPIHPHLPVRLLHWQTAFAADQARAFDRHGWSYYTREWADAWAPFYSDAWGSLNGAIGILYEQARYAGQAVRRESGEIVTYREAVERQALSAWTNVRSLASHREGILRDFAAHRSGLKGNERPRFVLELGRHPSRERWLLATLAAQGVEWQGARTAAMSNVLTSGGEALAEWKVEGALAWLDVTAQPAGALAASYLDFDTRLSRPEWEEERRRLETRGESKLYDVTAWNLVHALDLKAWWCAQMEVESSPLAEQAPIAGIAGPLVDPTGGWDPYAWIVDGGDDLAVRFAAHALELGVKLRLAEEEFQVEGRSYPRGSLLIRRHENDSEVAAKVERAARASGVAAQTAFTARSSGTGVDLGGQRFALLERPRIAIVTNAPASPSSFGHVWHHLDRELQLPASLVDAQQLSGVDLRAYNVLVFPAGDFDGVYARWKEELASWIRGGGTLIGMGSSAAGLAKEDLGLSQVRRRRDVLKNWSSYCEAARKESQAGHSSIDEGLLWDGVRAKTTESQISAPATGDKSQAPTPSDEDRLREEDWKERFAPAGVYVRARTSPEHWLTCGATTELPVFSEGRLVLAAREPVQTPVRLVTAERLRLSGLLWPEARERMAESAWATVERLGHGQIVLFAAEPVFRGYHKACARLFSNAVVLGPGMGANPPPPH
jgi:hypothetical protein